jgi:hypothetical protein
MLINKNQEAIDETPYVHVNEPIERSIPRSIETWIFTGS